MELNGTVAFITGGVAGIGLAVAKELLRNGAKNVTLIDTNDVVGKQVVLDLQKDYDEKTVTFIKANVTDKDDFENAVKSTVERFKTIDIFFNNAGILEEEPWEKMVDINLKGVITGTYLAIKYLGKENNGKGCVVLNMSSRIALDSFKQRPVYTATKYGVSGLGRALGHQSHYDRTGINVITLYLGLTNTGLLNDAIIYDDVTKEYIKMSSLASQCQLPAQVGVHVVNVLKKAEVGSHWYIDDNKCYRLEMPTLDDFKKTELQL